MHVGPQDDAIDAGGGMHQVVVVVPVDGQIDKAEHVACKHRSEAGERPPVAALRDFELQHHDGDDDSDHAVAKRSQSLFRHS